MSNYSIQYEDSMAHKRDGGREYHEGVKTSSVLAQPRLMLIIITWLDIHTAAFLEWFSVEQLACRCGSVVTIWPSEPMVEGSNPG